MAIEDIASLADILEVTSKGETVTLKIGEFLDLWPLEPGLYEKVQEWAVENNLLIWQSPESRLNIRMVTMVEADSVWEYKGKHYRVNSVMQKNLIQYDDDWRPTVRYTLEPPDGLVFYRSDLEFMEKFNHVQG